MSGRALSDPVEPLSDLYYPGDSRPTGVFATSLDPDIASLLSDNAAVVREGLGSRLLDCGYASAAWAQQLRRAECPVTVLGGDPEAIGSDYASVPASRQSGFRRKDGSLVRHWWLSIGQGGWLFDPTAHQFDDRGGVTIENYVLDGLPLAAPEGLPVVPEGEPQPIMHRLRR